MAVKLGKLDYELRYWKGCLEAEKVLKNGHYSFFYTSAFSLGYDFYNNKRILDIGCGPRGSLEWADNSLERTGLDPLVEEYRPLGIDSHKMRYLKGNAEKVPFQDGYFDVVASYNSLDHVDDIDRSIEEIVRVLAPGGTFLLITEVNHAPTKTEPVFYSWDISKRFLHKMDLVYEKRFKKTSGIYESILDNMQPEEGQKGVLAARFVKKANFWGITSFFNPVGYENKKKNYDKFRAFSKKQGLSLLAVELAFGDKPFELSKDDADIIIQIRTAKDNILWQKEALLNIGLKNLPQDCDKFAWLDCDIIFEDNDWIKEALKLLDSYNVVQLFSYVVRLEPGRNEGEKLRGHVYCIKSGAKKNNNTGYAWAARKEVFEGGGFFDKAILGGGDRLMCYAFCGDNLKDDSAKNWIRNSYPSDIAERYNLWAEKISKKINGKFSYLDSHICHLWHGSKKDRMYEDRFFILEKNNFIFDKDVKRDRNGLWSWSQGAKIKEDFKNYFRFRNEGELLSAEGNRINVCTACDKNLVRYLPTLLNSISQNTSTQVSFFLLARDISDKMKKRLSRIYFPNIKLNIIDVKSNFFGTKLKLLEYTTVSTMDRLFLCSIFPKMKKVIYLDMDLVVNADLAELYSLETPPRGVCARTCFAPPYNNMRGMIEVWIKNKNIRVDDFEKQVNLECKCLNAGVLVLDLDKLRKNQFEEKMISLVKKYGFNDQISLNIYCCGDYNEIPPSWNVFAPYESPQEKSIVHWIGRQKPWKGRGTALIEYWDKYYFPFDISTFAKLKTLAGRIFEKKIRPADLYWKRRSNLRYYDEVVNLCQLFAINVKSVIDVGSHKSEVLRRLSFIKDRTALDIGCLPEMGGISKIRKDFMKYEPDRKYDLALCLQVLEHVDSPEKFMSKVLSISKISIISVPYMWPQAKYHKHNMINEEKLFKWAKKHPVYSKVISEKNCAGDNRRIIQVYIN